MTEGSPWKNILIFAMPMLFGNIVQQLYNTADAVIVGKFVGDNALAAVGGAGPVINLLIVLFIGISSGSGIMVSQYFGAKQREELSHTIGTCITLLTAVSVVFTIAAPPFVRPLLRLLNTPETILEWCAQYTVIFIYGTLGLAFYNILSGILRGLGDSYSPLVFLVTASLLNIGLDLLFVAVFGMGVAGAALATIISQGISGILCIWRLLRMRDVFDLGVRYLKPRKKHVKQLLRLGLPTGAAQALFSVAIVVVQSLTNSFGEMFIACNVIVMRVDGFVMMPNFTFSNAIMTYTGQNVGAGKLDRVKLGARDCMVMAVATAVVIVIALLIWGRHIMGLFTNTQELIDLSMYMMRILAFGYIAIAVSQVASGVIRGAGDTVAPMWITFVTTIAVRVPLAYLLAYLTRSADYPVGRPESVFISMLVSWTLGCVITSVVYLRGKWKGKGISMEPRGGAVGGLAEPRQDA